jgi:Bacterial Ig-like domain/WD40-like Beta Propeller Repeat
MNHDPDLDDVLQDDELVRLGGLLRSTLRAEPPLDEAFRSALRRQLMQTAWEMGEGHTPWWRRLSAPATPSLAWVGAAAGVLLIASVVVYTASQQPGVGVNELIITSPIADEHAVQLQQPILVAFNQPMDHKSTEKAVTIAPATYVAFSWNVNTLKVQPTSGILSPNTQYQVTIGPGARTQAGNALLTSPKTITFITQPSAAPTPTPRPTASPTTGPLAEHKLTAVPSGTGNTPQWSADSTTIYMVGNKGALQSVAASDGTVKVLVADGVSFLAIAPAGDRLAFVRAGKIQVLTLSSGSTADVAAVSGLTALSWANTQLFWATGDGVFKSAPDGPTQVAPGTQGSSAILSIAPDGAHAIVDEGHSLSILDLATSKSTKFGGGAAAFLSWSPDGSRLLYRGSDATVVADTSGQTIATLLSGDTSWSVKDEILVGNDTALIAVRPDGYGQTKLSTGTYRLPAWAPNGTTFAFVRGGAIWSGTAAPLAPEPAAIDQAAAVVTAFMNARLKPDASLATGYLDGKGKQAYSSSGLPLLINGDASLSRFYIVAQEMTARYPDTARFVVRLVLTKGTLDVNDYDETLTLKRDQGSDPFLIDQATAGPTRDLGKGAQVVSVDIAAGSIKVVFDSDLVSDTVADGVVLTDDKGKRIGGPSTYANRTVVITGLQLAPGASYKLAVLTTVQDVSGRNVPSEYDLSLVGPAATASTGGQGNVSNPPSPLPTPTPSPVVSPTPAS